MGSASGPVADAGSAGPELRRAVSLPWLVLYGLGTTIGAGIYALTGVVAGRAGMHAPFAFAAASLLALFSALSFAELSTRFPRAGGEAVYVLEGFRSLALSRVVGLLVVLAGLISAATVSVGMVGYLGALVPLPAGVTVLGVVGAIGAIAAWGVRESVTLAGLITLVEIGGLGAVIVAGGGSLAELPARLGEIVPSDAGAFRAVGAAAVLCFYAFLGFEDLVNVAEEVEDVRRALPRAILGTLGLSALLYVVLATVAVLAVPPAELARAEAPLSRVFESGGGPPRLLSGIAVLALANGGLVQVVKASRVLYGLAREGALPARLGSVHPRTHTPLAATVLATAIAAGFAFSLPLEQLAEITSLVTLTTFALANAALLLVRRRRPEAPATLRLPRRRPEAPAALRLPGWVPAVGALASAAFVIFELSRLWRA